MSYVPKILMIFSVLLIVGCVSNPPPLVPESQGIESISAIGMTCSKPYKLVNECSNLTGPKKKLNILGVDTKSAATEDGKVIALFATSGMNPNSENINLAFEMAKRELTKNDVKILTVRPIMSSNVLFGYMLLLDKPGYKFLLEHAK